MASQRSTPENKTSTRKKTGGKGKRGNKNAQPPTNDSIVALAALLEIKRQPTATTQSSHPSTPSLNPICASGDAPLHPSPSLQVPVLPSSQQQQQQQAALGHHLWHQHRQQHNLRASPPLALAASSSATCAGSPSAAAAALMYPPSAASSSVAVRAVNHQHHQAAMARFLRHPEAVRQHAAAVAAAARSGAAPALPPAAAEANLGVPRLPPLVGGPIGMQALVPSPQQMTIGRGQLISPVAIMPQGLIGLNPQSQAMAHSRADARAPAPCQAQAQAEVQPQTQTRARTAPQGQPTPKPRRSSPGSPTTRNEEGASSLFPGQPLPKRRVIKSIANRSIEPPATKNARPALTSSANVATPEASVASAWASPASSLSPQPQSSTPVPVAATAAATKKTSKPPHPPPEELIRPEEVQAALRSKPQRGKKRDNLSLSERMELTRTRNREHAKSTRVRKKARYQELLDREIEWKRLKEDERMAELRRRCVVSFMRLRTASVRRSRHQVNSWHCAGEASPVSTMTKPSLSPLSNNADETQSPRGQNGHSTPAGNVQAAEKNDHNAGGQEGCSTPTGTAQADEGNAQNIANGNKGNLTVNEMVETTPENSPSEPSLSATEATKGGKSSSEGGAGPGSTKDELDNAHTQFTSLDDCVEDRTGFCFGSLLLQTPFGKDISKMDGLTALSRHDAACRECVLQQWGAEAANHLTFSVVDSEQGIAIVHDSGFAQFRLTVATPGGEDDGGDRMVSAGMMRVTFAPRSHELRGIELCSYDTGRVVAPESNNGNQGVVSPGIQNGIMTPVSFPSVVSLENAFHDFVGVTSCDSGQDRYCNTPTKTGSSRQVGVSPEDRIQDGPHRETNGSPDEQHGPGMNYDSAHDDIARSDGN